MLESKEKILLVYPEMAAEYTKVETLIASSGVEDCLCDYLLDEV